MAAVPRPLVTTIAAACVALAAGCGGEDRLSTDDYRAELRKICSDSERRTEQVTEPTRATPEAIADYLRRLRDVSARSIEQVEDLEPPEDLQDAHDQALDANREGRAKIDEVIGKLEDGEDPNTVLQEARTELEDATNRADEAAREVGVPECVD